MEVEIFHTFLTFFFTFVSKCAVPPDWQEYIQVGSIGIVRSRVFYLNLSGIHLSKIILLIWIIDWQYVIDVSICEVELRC